MPGLEIFYILSRLWKKCNFFLDGSVELQDNLDKINKYVKIYKKDICNLYNIPSCEKREPVLLYSQKG